MSEIESLISWYKQFKKSYHALFLELQRRIIVENSIEEKVSEYRKKLQQKFENEINHRNKFNKIGRASCRERVSSPV